MNEDIKKMIYEIREVLAGVEMSDFYSDSFYHFLDFPIACCGDTTDLLGLYLLQHHELESEYICGDGLGENLNKTHAWLLCQGYIVDITADQFNDEGYKLPSVIIDKKSSFHELFHETTSRQTSIEYIRCTNIPSLLEKVISVINAKACNK